MGRASFSEKRIDLPSCVPNNISWSPFVILASINWSSSLISIAYIPPFLGFPYADRTVFLTTPFLVAITIKWSSLNSLTLTKASTLSVGSQPIRLTIARPLVALPPCGIS